MVPLETQMCQKCKSYSRWPHYSLYTSLFDQKANDARRSAAHLPVAPLPVAPLPVTQAEGHQFVCETCSKEYKLEETYQAHISAHKKVLLLW